MASAANVVIACASCVLFILPETSSSLALGEYQIERRLTDTVEGGALNEGSLNIISNRNQLQIRLCV